MLNNRKISQVD